MYRKILAILILTFVFIFISKKIYANNSTEDLKIAIEKAKTTKEKIDAYEPFLNQLRREASPELRAATEELKKLALKEKNTIGLALADAYFFEYFLIKRQVDSAEVYALKAMEKYKSAQQLDKALEMMRLLTIYLYLRTDRSEQGLQLLESGLELAKEEKDNQLLILANYNIGFYYYNIKDSDSTSQYMRQSMQYAKDAKNWKYYAKAISLIAGISFQKNPEESLKLAQEGLAICEKHDLLDEKIKLLVNIFDIHRKQGNVRAASEIGYEKLRLRRKQGKSQTLVNDIRQVGEIHSLLKEEEEAEKYFKESLQMGKELKYSYGIIAAASSLGGLYDDLAQPEKGILFHKEALQEAEQLKNPFVISQVLNALGESYSDLEQHDTAKIHLQRSINILPTKESILYHLAKINLAIIDYHTGNFSEAIKNVQPVLSYAQQVSDNLLLGRSWQVLADAHESQGNYKKALYYYKKRVANRDSINSEQNIKELTSLELNSQFEKEKELTALENKKQQEVLQAEANTNRAIAFGIGALALLGFGFFWNARQKNKTISQQNAQLEQLNTTKDRLFAIIGHDLRKPAISFRGISKKVNYLIRNKDFPTLEKLGTQIEQNALSLNKLTDNLLNWALMQRDVMPYNPQEILLEEIIDDVQTIFTAPASEKNIQLKLDIPNGLSIYADPNALTTILTNLVDNAIKYTSVGGVVTITAVAENSQVKIRVADTGIGMDKDKINDIFLLEKNKSEKGTAGEKGTGLGLHLVKELVQLNKGVISTVSELGKGTQFNISLPKMALH